VHTPLSFSVSNHNFLFPHHGLSGRHDAAGGVEMKLCRATSELRSTLITPVAFERTGGFAIREAAIQSAPGAVTEVIEYL